MRILKVLVILVIVGYGGAKGYAYYKVKSEADTLVQQAAMFANITYDGIYTDLRGEIGLDGIKINIPMTGDQFRINSIRVRGPNILFLLGQDFSKEFPEEFGLSIKGLNVGLGSQIFAMMEQAGAQQGMQGGATFQNSLIDDSLGCGSVQGIGPTELVQMGYTELNIDLDFDSSYNAATRTTTMRVMNAVSDIGRSRLEMQVEARPSPMFFASLAMGQAPIKKLSYEVTDSGYYSRRNQFCARANGGSAEEYIDRHLGLLSQEIGAGIPDEAREAYRQFMLNGGTVSATALPDGIVDFTKLPFYETQDVINMLNLSVAINGQDIALNQFAWGTVDAPAAEQSAGSETVEAETPTNAPLYEQQYTYQQRASYHPIQLSAVADYLNYKIKIITTSGTEREGILRKVAQGQLTIEVANLRGNLVYNIKLKDISRAEAFY